MRKMILGVVVALGLFAGGVFAQDYIYDFRGANIDVALKSPCETSYGGTLTKTASGPHVYDGSAWITFVCENGMVYTRRYLNPNDNAKAPIAVYTVTIPGTVQATVFWTGACATCGSATV